MKLSPSIGYTLHAGDCLDVLRTMPADQVQCCVTSPPYWSLRDYGIEGQIGLEPTVDEYVTRIVAVFREVRRVLRVDGTLWLNLGDIYLCGRSGGIGTRSAISARNHTAARAAWRARQEQGTHRRTPGLKPKDLVGLPWRVAFALQADGWWLRSEIIWSKPAPMPEAVRDRPTRAHEQVFLLAKSERYYYDATAIRERTLGTARPRGAGTHPKSLAAGAGVKANASFSSVVRGLVEWRNKRSVWSIASQPFSGAHFATFPPKLVEPCVLAGSRPGDLVLDPFSGAATTGVVALGLGRRYCGIELSPEYVAMSEKRLRRATAQLNLFHRFDEQECLGGEAT